MVSILNRLRAFAFCATLVLCPSLTTFAIAQSPPASGAKVDYKFEVATIKPVDLSVSGIEVGTDIDPGGVVRLHALSLKSMVETGFNVQYWQIEGGEAWMQKNLYNVVGEPSDEVRRTMPDTRHTLYSIGDPRLREMLQALLVERFALKVHTITQPGKVYLLERTSKSLALHPSNTPPSTPSSDQSTQSTFGSIGFAGRWVLSDTTMPELANFASSYILHCPVSDHTGLTGAFDYRSEPEDSNTQQTDQSDSFVTLLSEAGLKLEPSSGQVEKLVIDHADLPSPN